MTHKINFKKKNNNKYEDLLTLNDNHYVNQFFKKRGFEDNHEHQINVISMYVLSKELKDIIHHTTEQTNGLQQIKETYHTLTHLLKNHINKDDDLYYHCQIS